LSWLSGYHDGRRSRRFRLRSHGTGCLPSPGVSPPGSFSHEQNRPLQSRFSQLSAFENPPERRRPKSTNLNQGIDEDASWGFCVPSSRHQLVVSTCRVKIPASRYVPSSAFHPPSTVCSTTCLVGLFRPTTTSRVFPSGVWPHREAVPGLPRPSCPPAVSTTAPAYPKMAPARCPRLQGFAPHGECDESWGVVRPPSTPRPSWVFSPPGFEVTSLGSAFTLPPPTALFTKSPP